MNQFLRLPVERFLIGQSQVFKRAALKAPYVIVLLAGDFIARGFAAHLVFLNVAVIRELPQVSINRPKADGRNAAPRLGKHLVSCRMIAAALYNLEDNAALAAGADGFTTPAHFSLRHVTTPSLGMIPILRSSRMPRGFRIVK